MYKWLGACLIIAGCGGVGFSIASNYRKKEKLLRQLIRILQFMERELQFRLTPLPELCRQAAKEVEGSLGLLFQDLANQLNRQVSPEVSVCMEYALKTCPDIPPLLRKHLLYLGRTLGRFDLSGQIQGIRAAKTACRESIQYLDHDRENRLRSYQTLGICAGSALVVLLA